jgi:hypothetical protein
MDDKTDQSFTAMIYVAAAASTPDESQQPPERRRGVSRSDHGSSGANVR